MNPKDPDPQHCFSHSPLPFVLLVAMLVSYSVASFDFVVNFHQRSLGEDLVRLAEPVPNTHGIKKIIWNGHGYRQSH
jgi:hypothetical protein